MERPHPLLTSLLTALAQAMGAVTLSTRAAAKNSQDAKQSAEKVAQNITRSQRGDSRRNLWGFMPEPRKQREEQPEGPISRHAPFDVLSGRVEGDTNAREITRLLRGLQRRPPTPAPSRPTLQSQPVAYENPETGEFEARPEEDYPRLAVSGKEGRRRQNEPRLNLSMDPLRQKPVLAEAPSPFQLWREKMAGRLRKKAKSIQDRQAMDWINRADQGKRPEGNLWQQMMDRMQGMLGRKMEQASDVLQQPEPEESILPAEPKPPTMKEQAQGFGRDFFKGWSQKRQQQRQARSKMLRSLIERFTGGGQGGEEPPTNTTTPAGTPGGTPPTNGPGLSPAAATAAEKLGQVAAAAIPVVGTMAAMAVITVKTGAALHHMAQTTVENSREMARFSGTIQGALAQYERQNRLLMVKAAQGQAASIKGLASTTAELNKTLQPYTTAFSILINRLLQGTEMLLTGVVKGIEGAIPGGHGAAAGIAGMMDWNKVMTKGKGEAGNNDRVALEVALQNITAQRNEKKSRVPQPNPHAPRMHRK